MAKQPPVLEREFLKLCRNHGELTSILTQIGINGSDVTEYAKHVGQCWFILAEEHLAEARQALRSRSSRASFSRAYYAAYNASKAARYISRGSVSLLGDDHKKAATELPDDIPDLPDWARRVNILYEHRLIADYDNWSDSAANRTIAAAEAVSMADDFIIVVKNYLNSKYGMTL